MKVLIERTIELEVQVSAYVTKYYPAVHTLSNGDPGYPAEGGDVEDVEIYLVHPKSGEKLYITQWLNKGVIKDFDDDLKEADSELYLEQKYLKTRHEKY